MKYKILFFTFFLATINAFGQFSIIGENVCTDGSQTTEIGLSDSRGGVFYVLFRNNKSVSFVSRQNSGIITFGKFSEPGIYEVVEIEKLQSAHPSKSEGALQKGRVIIEEMPRLINVKPIEIISGDRLSFIPNTSVPGSRVKWTCKLASGQVTGFSKSGEGAIIDQLVLKNEAEAELVYMLTPISPGSCFGKTVELKIKVLKSK